MIEINVNDKVRVQLTSLGEAMLARHRLKEYEELLETFGPDRDNKGALPERALLDIWRDHERDADGWRTFQAYELMWIFGTAMSSVAQEKPFQNNRIVLETH